MDVLKAECDIDLLQVTYDCRKQPLQPGTEILARMHARDLRAVVDSSK
jgi:hypothetical protein